MKGRMVAFIVFVLVLASGVEAGQWWEKVNFKGDFRHRHEFIRDESMENANDRNRWRIRLRFSLSGKISEDWSVHTRFATGSDDPVSANQTLDSGFSTKGFHLDRAYFAFHPQAMKCLKLTGGKIERPFLVMDKTELIWDGDLNPEGMALSLNRSISKSVDIIINGAFFYVEERKNSDDTWMAGLQAAVDASPSEKTSMVLGGGYYDYRKLEGMEGIYDPGNFFGNDSRAHQHVDGEDTTTLHLYSFDYDLLEGFVKFGVKQEEVSFQVYGNYVQNIQADSLDKGWLIGGSMTYGDGKGHFKVRANWRELEKNAVVGVFTDSDFRGGGTDGKGLEANVEYGLSDKVNLGISYFRNSKGVEEDLEYNRAQADLKLKF